MQPNDSARKRAPKRPSVARACEVCGAAFMAWASQASRSGRPFCGAACSAIGRSTKVECTCVRCGQVFLETPYRIGQGRGKFCSRGCADAHQREEAPVEIRLWGKVDRNGLAPEHRPEYGGCWWWTGHRNRAGYGRLYRHFPTPVMTHRLAWEIATGDGLTPDDVIGHVCDVRHCVRNDDEGFYEIRGVLLPRRGHLFKGTHEDNRLDMLQKGRGAFVLGAYVKRGEGNHNARLTDDDVRQIRALYAQGGITQATLGQRFGVTQNLVSKVILRQAWKHVN